MTWLALWKGLLIVSLVAFGLLGLFISVDALSDIRSLLSKLSKQDTES